jgi:hypothetical protein
MDSQILPWKKLREKLQYPLDDCMSFFSSQANPLSLSCITKIQCLIQEIDDKWKGKYGKASWCTGRKPVGMLDREQPYRAGAELQCPAGVNWPRRLWLNPLQTIDQHVKILMWKKELTPTRSTCVSAIYECSSPVISEAQQMQQVALVSSIVCINQSLEERLARLPQENPWRSARRTSVWIVDHWPFPVTNRWLLPYFRSISATKDDTSI